MPLTMVLSETTNGQTITYWQGLDTLAQSDGTDVRYFQYDGLGSVRQVVDDAGEVGVSQTFDPYGNPYASAGSASTSLGFTGEFSDSNGFVFLRARYYNPGAGRFFQTDPSRQEKNPYLYASGNPVMFIDPTGKESCWEDVCQSNPPVSKPYIKGSSSCTSGGNCGSVQFLGFEPSEGLAPVFEASGRIPRSQFDVLKYPGGHDPENNQGYYNFCGTFSITAIYQHLGGNLGVDEIMTNVLIPNLGSTEVKSKNKETGQEEIVTIEGGTPERAKYTIGWGVLHELAAHLGLRTLPDKNVEGETRDYYTYPGNDYRVYYPRYILPGLKFNWWPIAAVNYESIGHPKYRLTDVAGTYFHWVVIPGVSDANWGTDETRRWVRVYNPFVNGAEYYRAEDFWTYQLTGHPILWVSR